jgi:hypothetical protein
MESGKEISSFTQEFHGIKGRKERECNELVIIIPSSLSSTVIVNTCGKLKATLKEYVKGAGGVEIRCPQPVGRMWKTCGETMGGWGEEGKHYILAWE